MTPFTYFQPAGLEEAFCLVAEHGPGTRLMAGGQSLLLALKERLARPPAVVSLSRIPELSAISYAQDGSLEVGAATTYLQLQSAVFTGWHRQIGAIAGNLADRSVRSMGTIGGGACQADPRYDVPTLLVASGARMVIGSIDGMRSIEAAAFFSPAGGTTLGPRDILCRIVFPPAGAFASFGFDKFRFRVFDAAVVNAALAVTTDGAGRITIARLVFGGIAACPSVADAAGARLCGVQRSEMASLPVADIAAQASEEVLPIATATTRHRQFQSELIKTITAGLLTQAGAPGG